jgi:hypothetical protein
MDCCGLSSTGLNDIDANNITADNITISPSLTVSGTNILLEINNINGDIIDINTNLSNINGIINYSFSNLNITGTTKVVIGCGHTAVNFFMRLRRLRFQNFVSPVYPQPLVRVMTMV